MTTKYENIVEIPKELLFFFLFRENGTIVQNTFSFSLLVKNCDIHSTKYHPALPKLFQHHLQIKIDHRLHLLCIL